MSRDKPTRAQLLSELRTQIETFDGNREPDGEIYDTRILHELACVREIQRIVSREPKLHKQLGRAMKIVRTIAECDDYGSLHMDEIGRKCRKLNAAQKG